MPLRGKRICHPDMERALNEYEALEEKSREFQLFSEDKGPQLYHPPNNLVTKPLIPKNLPKVFENLPIHGKPEPGMSLNRFNKNRLKAFLGGMTDKEFKELSKSCSTDHLKCGNELVMGFDIPDKLLMDVNAEFRAPPCDCRNPPRLHILQKKRDRVREDEDGRFLKNTLKYGNVHVIPINQQAKSLNEKRNNTASEETAAAGPTFKKSKKSGKNRKHSHSKFPVPDAFDTPTANADDLAVPSTSGATAKAAAGNVAPPPEDQMEPGTDILIKIRIYKPFDYEEYKNKPNRSLSNLFYHDLILTGRNKVSDIKDRFVCSEKGLDPKAKANNGFLFIKNGFYVDKGDAAAAHAESLRKWCSARNFGNFPKHDMRECRLDQLEYKLGNPDVYIHDETCEHIIIFSEVRLLNANDPLYFSDYPRITTIAQNTVTPFCYNCADFGVKWIVSGCARIPFNMALFCQPCLKKVLYDTDGKKICKFKAYPYKGLDVGKH